MGDHLEEAPSVPVVSEVRATTPGGEPERSPTPEELLKQAAEQPVQSAESVPLNSSLDDDPQSEVKAITERLIQASVNGEPLLGAGEWTM